MKYITVSFCQRPFAWRARNFVCSSKSVNNLSRSSFCLLYNKFLQQKIIYYLHKLHKFELQSVEDIYGEKILCVSNILCVCPKYKKKINGILIEPRKNIKIKFLQQFDLFCLLILPKSLSFCKSVIENWQSKCRGFEID